MSFPVTINGNTYTAAQFVNYGHQDNFPAIVADVATVAGQAQTNKNLSDTAAALAQAWAEKEDGIVDATDYSAKEFAIGTQSGTGGSAKGWAVKTSGQVDSTDYSAKEFAIGTQSGTGGSAKGWAQTAEDVEVPGTSGGRSSLHYNAKAQVAASTATTAAATAVGAAASATKGIDFATTTGTGAAYAADFTPDITIADGVLFNLNIHTANTVTNPTLAVEGGTAYTLVHGYDRRPIPIGLLSANVNVTVTFDGTNNEYAIIAGLPLHEFNRNLNGRGYTIDDVVLTNAEMTSGNIGPNVTGINNLSIVATGSIGDGVTVALNSDGTVSAVSSSSTALNIDSTGNGTATDLASPLNDSLLYIPSLDRVVAISGTDVYVGTVSGQSITFGSASSFSTKIASISSASAVVHIPETNNIVIVSDKTVGPNYSAAAVVGTINTLTNLVTFGTESTKAISTVSPLSAAFVSYDSTADRFVYSYAQSSGALGLLPFSVSGTTVTFGSTVTTYDSVANNFSLGTFHDPKSGKNIVFYVKYFSGITDINSYYALYALVFSIDDLTLTVESPPIDFEVWGERKSLGQNRNLVSFVYDEENDIVLLLNIDGLYDRVEIVTLDIISGYPFLADTFVFKNSSDFQAANFDVGKIAFENTSKTFALSLFYNAGTDGNYVFFSLENKKPSISSQAQWVNGEHSSINVTSISDGKFLFCGTGGSSGNAAYIHQAPWVDTNYEQFIGVCKGSFTNGQTALIQTKGALATGLSGLTAGSTYYVANDGSLTTTKTDVKAGRALSTTSLYLE